MPTAEWLRPPRAALTLFLALISVCAVALAWLSWQVIEQERLVEAQRLHERLENAADRAVFEMHRALDRAAGANGGPAEGEALVVIAPPDRIEVQPRGALAFVPAAVDDAPAPPVFRDAEAAEFSGRDLEAAAREYERLAGSRSAIQRGEALMRLGRVLRKLRQWDRALAAYRRLEANGSVPVAGLPADLLARGGRCSVLEERGGGPALRAEALAFAAEVTQGRWTLSEAALDSYSDDVRRWAGELPLPPDWAERMAMAKAASRMYVRAGAAGAAEASAFQSVDGMPVFGRWSAKGGTWSARLTGPSFWRDLWKDLAARSAAEIHITAETGEILFGVPPASRPAVHRPAAATGLPCNITVAPAASGVRPASVRAPLIVSVFGVLVVLLGAGSYFIVRSISREMAVARLQSNFAAAVSHEFRSPLASIRQLSEMLARGRLDTPAQIGKAYELILNESERLRKLVESLLDFARVESGAYRPQTRECGAAEWARGVVEEFAPAARENGYSVDFASEADGVRIRADVEALSRALWNLLENAVKYSPEDKRIEVSVAETGRSVEVRVRDRGIGVPAEDAGRIFDKFYRAGNARKSGMKGVGIGLATAREIVRAHRGDIRVKSAPGTGTVFTILLPAKET